MATYDLSASGHSIVVGEDHLPVLRVVLIVVLLVVALVLKFNEGLVFWSLWTDLRLKRHRIFLVFYLIYTIHSILFIVYSADSTARPVHYFVQRFLYQKYVISSMELPFALDLSIIVLGYHGFTRAILARLNKQDEQMGNKCVVTLVYVVLSLRPILHYRTQPPHHFSVGVNSLVMSGSVAALATTVVVSYISYLNINRRFVDHSNRDLLNLNISYGQNSDDEEIETFNALKIETTRQRTPTKITPV